MVTLGVIVAMASFAPPAVTAATKPTIVFGAAVSLTGPLSHEGNLTKEGYDFGRPT